MIFFKLECITEASALSNRDTEAVIKLLNGIKWSIYCKKMNIVNGFTSFLHLIVDTGC